MILVTGGTGLIGSHLIYGLLRRGSEVKVLIRESSNRNRFLDTFRYYSADATELFQRIHWVIGDITDPVTLEEAFEGVVQVYHLAAVVSFRRREKQRIHEVNVMGTANLVNLCLEKKVHKLCFVSSVAAISLSSDGTPSDEREIMKPDKKLSAYSKSKFLSEMEVWRGISEGLRAVIVNPSVVLGPGYCKGGSADLFISAADGLPFYTRGSTGFVDVRDVSECMIRLMNTDIHSERFILNSEDLTFEDFIAEVTRVLHKRNHAIYLNRFFAGIFYFIDQIVALALFRPPRLSKDLIRMAYSRQKYSNTKVCKAIDFNFRPFNETLQDIATFYFGDRK